MPKVKIPIFNDTYSSVEGATLSVVGTEMINCYVDSLGYLRTRPLLSLAGIISKSTVGTDINAGLFWSTTKQKLIWVCDQLACTLAWDEGTSSFDTTYFNSTDAVSQTATFTEATNSNVVTPTTYVAFAQGGRINLISGIDEAVTTMALIADAEAPTTCTHVDSVDGFLIGNSGKRTFQASDVNAPDTWSALSFASAMRNPDKTLAIKVYQRQLFIFGEKTTEIWQIDPTSLTFPFSPVSNGFLDIGIFGDYSPIVARTGLYWVTDQKKLARYKDGQIDYPGDPGDDFLHQVRRDYSLIASEIIIRGVSFLLFYFSTTGEGVDAILAETFLFNQESKQWSKWTSMRDSGDGSNTQESKFLGAYGVFHPPTGQNHFISLRGGRIYKLQEDAISDAGELGVNARRITGHLDFGTNARKRTREVLLRVKAGQGRYGVVGGEDRPAARLQVRWNDDNKGFSSWMEVPLGDVGDYEIVRKFQPRGIYRTRQYEISLTDASNYIIGEVEEDMEILR